MNVFDALPDEMRWYLMRGYLRERDSLAVVLSGVSPRFTKLFWGNR